MKSKPAQVGSTNAVQGQHPFACHLAVPGKKKERKRKEKKNEREKGEKRFKKKSKEKERKKEVDR